MDSERDRRIVASHCRGIDGKTVVRHGTVLPVSINGGDIVFLVLKIIRKRDSYRPINRGAFCRRRVLSEGRFAPGLADRVEVKIGITVGITISRMGEMGNA